MAVLKFQTVVTPHSAEKYSAVIASQNGAFLVRDNWRLKPKLLNGCILFVHTDILPL